jgi:hypothetical protein
MKMFAAYLEQEKGITIYEDQEKLKSIKASQLDIKKIHEEINQSPNRFQRYDWKARKLGSGGSKGMEITVIKKVHSNYWNNFVWWLETHCSDLKFVTDAETDTTKAASRFKKYIDEGYPVMVGTSNTHSGHIILVIGYEIDDTSAPLNVSKMSFICHDPFGIYKFNIEMKKWKYIKNGRKTDQLPNEDLRRRLACGGQDGNGKSVEYDYKRVGKLKKETGSVGVFRMLYVKN